MFKCWENLQKDKVDFDWSGLRLEAVGRGWWAVGEYTKTNEKKKKKAKPAESQTQICPIIKEEIANPEAFINHPKLISHLRTIP